MALRGPAFAQGNENIFGTSTPVNYSPAANLQSVTTIESRPVEVFLTGYDGNNDILMFLLSTPPTFGALGPIDQLTGAVTYSPIPEYYGDDSFEFAVTDGIKQSDPAKISIIVLKNQIFSGSFESDD